jgi:hypothetical protein
VIRTGALLLLTAVALAAALPVAGQDAPVTVVDPRSNLEWTPWISDVPIVDLSGTWVYDAARSDPMLKDWQGEDGDGDVIYEIFHQPDRIVLRFLPAAGDSTVESFSWTGRVEADRRDGMSIRQRAHWTAGGRVFEIEGRWWLIAGEPEPRHFAYRYQLEGNDTLIFTQEDDHGATVWRFRRRR